MFKCLCIEHILSGNPYLQLKDWDRIFYESRLLPPQGTKMDMKSRLSQSVEKQMTMLIDHKSAFWNEYHFKLDQRTK